MNRSQFLEVLNKYDVTLDTDNELYDLTVDAPKGKVFAASGSHSLCEPWNNNGGQSWKPQAYADMAERVSLGLRDCEDSECECRD